jgi:hypothetical protein
MGERAGALHHAALNIAAALNAYLLCDRGRWLNFKNRGALAVLVEGDRRLFNQYGVMLVNPARHPHVKQNERGLHRLARLAGRPAHDRRLPHRRRPSILPERRAMSELSTSFALTTAALAGFGRAIAEVGAVMIVGGNIEGVTRVMTTAIALETSKGDLPLALALGFVLITLALTLNAIAYALRRWAEQRWG